MKHVGENDVKLNRNPEELRNVSWKFFSSDPSHNFHNHLSFFPAQVIFLFQTVIRWNTFV